MHTQPPAAGVEFLPGANLDGVVTCAHPFGVGVYLTGHATFGHVNVPDLRVPTGRSCPDRVVVGTELQLEVLGYSGTGQLRLRVIGQATQARTSAQFAYRLDPETYSEDDEVVGVYEEDPSEADALWVSGRLFTRLTAVARAYELHTLALLHAPDALRLNRLQCQSVLDEIAFVAERLDDPLIAELATTITWYLTLRVRRPMWDGLVTFDGG